MIDDFGANEPDADAYADRDRVARRREATTALLTSVFDAATTAIPFVLTGHDDPRPAIDRAARDAVAALTHVQP